jgi:hypothetical protein
MPVSDPRVEIEPPALPGLAGGEGPADRGVEVQVSGCAEVIGSVDKSFEGIVHPPFWGSRVLVVAGGGGKFSPKKIFAIHQMHGLTCSEGGFQFGVVRFPSYHLGVGAREVRINNNLAGVRDEHLPDVR